MLKVIVAGSRGFQDYKYLETVLDTIFKGRTDIEIVSGTAYGADQLGERYAHSHNLSIKRFPANWNLYGKAAGYIRNEQMAKYADACITFWDGQSRGTMHMINLAKQYGLKLKVVKY